jgi:hypothetical protein
MGGFWHFNVQDAIFQCAFTSELSTFAGRSAVVKPGTSARFVNVTSDEKGLTVSPAPCYFVFGPGLFSELLLRLPRTALPHSP